MGMEPLIRLQNLSAPSLNMELFSVIQGSFWDKKNSDSSSFSHVTQEFVDKQIVILFGVL